MRAAQLLDGISGCDVLDRQRRVLTAEKENGKQICEKYTSLRNRVIASLRQGKHPVTISLCVRGALPSSPEPNIFRVQRSRKEAVTTKIAQTQVQAWSERTRLGYREKNPPGSLSGLMLL